MDSPLDKSTLHELLLPRVARMREYLDARIPPSLRTTLSADDILQDVRVAAYRNVEGFAGNQPDAPDRWLQALFHSKLVDAVRRARRLKRGGDARYVRPIATSTSFADVCALLHAPDRTPSRDARLAETAHTVLIALQQLEDRQRRVIELYFLSGLSHDVISERLGISNHAVKNALYRGLRALRAALGPAARYFTGSDFTEEAEEC